MIINNSPLGFHIPDDSCEDCRDDQFALPIALTDNASYQIDIACPELTGGLEKMECEDNLIGNYTENIARYTGTTEQPILGSEYIISANNISFTDFQDAGNLFATPVGFLEANRCYFIRYTISGYEKGYILAGIGDDTSPNARQANGTYAEVFCTDADGRLVFQVGNDDTPLVTNTFILSNITLICIRYGMLYDVTVDTEDDLEFITYAGQTSIEKTGESLADILISLREQPFFVGQSYKICFTISDMVSGAIDLLFGPTTPITYSGNGRFCVEIEYVDDTYSTQLQWGMSAAFVGKLTDITVYLVPDYRIELFDSEGNEVPDGLTVEQIDSTLKVSLNPNIDEGCYDIGVADNCSNYLNQFYGNILEGEFYSERILEAGVYPVLKSGNNFSLDYEGWADLPNGTVTYLHYFVIKNAICYEKLYDAEFVFSISDGGNSFQRVRVYLLPAGSSAIQQDVSPGVTVTLTFDDIIAGTAATDNCSLFPNTNPGALCPFVGENSLTVMILTEINKVGATPPEVTFSTDTSFVQMDQDTPQFCPEYFSVPLNVSIEAPCDTILLKYRNSQNAFDIDYTSDGYTEADGFYNQLRIPARLWKPNHPMTKQIQKNSTGRRVNYYTDVDKKYIFTTGLLPEAIHDALVLAVGHDYILIDGKEVVCSSDDYTPTWNKDSTLASVELEFFLQQSRKLNTKC